MDFHEFYKLLRSLFTKEVPDVVPTNNNFPINLVIRYISFYHPNLCIYIDNVFNDYSKIQLISDPKVAYNTFKAILPKFKFSKIDYIKKPVSTTVRNNEISNEEIQHLAELLECSKREVLLYLEMILDHPA